MDFSQINLADLIGPSENAPVDAEMSPNEMESDALPELSPDIKDALDKLDPLDIVNYLKMTEILPPEFKMPEMSPADVEDEGASEMAGGFGDISQSEAEAAIPAPAPAPGV